MRYQGGWFMPSMIEVVMGAVGIALLVGVSVDAATEAPRVKVVTKPVVHVVHDAKPIVKVITKIVFKDRVVYQAVKITKPLEATCYSAGSSLGWEEGTDADYVAGKDPHKYDKRKQMLHSLCHYEKTVDDE